MGVKKGYIHIYTGNGKGKTTTALGLAFRAIGAGLRVYFAQFVKKRLCSEHLAINQMSFQNIVFKRYGTGFVKDKNLDRHRKVIHNGFIEASDALLSGIYDVFIMDEINIAVHHGFVSVDEMLDLMQKKPLHTELILTGRYADDRLIASADLVTEMLQLKHYYDKGIKARKGIEF